MKKILLLLTTLTITILILCLLPVWAGATGSPEFDAIGIALVSSGVVTFYENPTAGTVAGLEDPESTTGFPGWYWAAQLTEQLGPYATPEPSEFRWDCGPESTDYQDDPYYGHLPDAGDAHYYMLWTPDLVVGNRVSHPQAYGTTADDWLIENDAVLEDGDGNALVLTYATVDIDGTGEIKIEVPYPSTSPKEFTDAADYTAWIAGGGYGVPNDYFKWTEDADTDGFNASAGDGTAGNEITYDGQGFTITGSQTFGDYSIITRFIHGSEITLGLGDTHKYSLTPVGDSLKVPEGATGCTIHDDGIPGTLDLDEQVGADTLGAELLNGGDFEAGGTGGDFNGGAEIDDGTSDIFDPVVGSVWVNNGVNDGNGDKIEATATVHSGNVAVKLTKTTTTVTARCPISDISFTAGKLYKLSYWTKGDGISCGYCNIYDRQNNNYILSNGGTAVTQDSWTLVERYFVAPAGCTSGDVSFGAPAVSIIHFDDASVKEVTSDTGIYNTWITDINVDGLDATEPVLFRNCAFVESKATIEAKNAVDVLFFDDECQFSIVTADCFRDYAGADYHLASGSPLKDAGEDTGEDVDLDGRSTPRDKVHDVGPYEYPTKAMLIN